jgi:hypothetical protein
MAIKKSKPSPVQIITLTVAGTLLLLVSIVAVVLAAQANKAVVNSFQTCKDAGGTIMESFPERCSKDGQTFTNIDLSAGDTDTSEYIGISEEAALSKAKTANVAARVVERDGETLLVTMDFSPGRLNFFVREDAVYKVQVEGRE